MTSLRPIEVIYNIEKEHWVGTGFRVRNYFPEGRNLLERFSPFALLDYNAPFDFPPSGTPRGIGPHPHRGLETVTLVFEGAVEHHDNEGNHGIIYQGDVQWMTAGKGIMHKEYHEKNFYLNGGVFHLVQLWTSLPKKYKYTKPRYQEILESDIGQMDLPDDAGNIRVVSGSFRNISGPAKTFSPINLYIISLNSGGKITLNEPGAYNTGILMISGNAIINSKNCNHKDFILFENTDGSIEIHSEKESSKLLVLSGQPLNEPAVAAGPFVMNTKEDLRQAAQDYREGKFGTEKF
jgi:redox-sensitive bicupin YhaK (pirin superfamily)